ncbi:CMRF35-like molecule 5 isoform X4 [Polypterus senegalus]|uniref:CMRF35-like molecule 5 isoform X4 n=1 Tax=Polypterus senegalus TaxID=55291 RepID=UPI001964B1E3|nr:CMRF35-like molecule 5 isoform X4 [Polypterus senegalus]
MKPTLHFVTCLISILGVTSHAELIKVNGVEGGSVKIDCRYGEGFEKHEKYLTNVRWSLNNVLIKTNKHNTVMTRSRYSLYDNTSVRVFTVTINELRMSDAGTYWCAVKKELADDYTEVSLTVHRGSASSSLTTTSKAGTASPSLTTTRKAEQYTSDLPTAPREAAFCLRSSPASKH